MRILNPCLAEGQLPDWCQVDANIYIPYMPEWQANLDDFMTYTDVTEGTVFYLGLKVNQFKIEGINVTVTIDHASHFAFYDNTKNAIVIYKKLTTEDIGYYRVDVVAKETVYNKTYTYEKSVYLRVTENEQKIPGPNPDEEGGASLSGYLSKYRLIRESKSEIKPWPYILSYDSYGKLKIGWTHQMNPPNQVKRISNTTITILAEPLQASRLRKLQSNVPGKQEQDI